MRRLVAFVGLAGALAGCAWRELSHGLAGALQSSTSEILLAGGVFTLAIAVLIRD
ncbi:MAG TPA: hypothetical protein VKV96_05365 [Roseiarcus sp.]|nr:hypothetical protein [Roseiarcus sp.]